VTKMDYVGSISPNRQTLRSRSQTPFIDSMNRKCAKTLLPLNIFGWCRCLAIWGQNGILFMMIIPVFIFIYRMNSWWWVYFFFCVIAAQIKANK